MSPLLVLALGLLLLQLHMVRGGAARVKRIVGGAESVPPPEDDPVVYVYKHEHDARVIGTREPRGGYYTFRGIKYAVAPTGRFRFQRARRLRLDGDVNATVFGAPCPQRAPGGAGFIGSEDCLSLNVFTPQLPAGEDERLPVVVWIHGGSWRSGSAAQYGPHHLVDKRLVVVTVQYRLGSLGFLSTGSKQLPGNVGLLDMRLALDWVQEYVGYFNGDADRVTLSGQDTGAVSAQLLVMAKPSRGLFRGVVAMSGSALSTMAVDVDPMATSRTLAVQNGCPTSPVLTMLRCLQALPVRKIISADSLFLSVKLAAAGAIGGLASLLSAGPAVEGVDDKRFLPAVLEKTPSAELSDAAFPSVPLLAGVTRNPTSTALLGGLRAKLEEQIRTVPEFVEAVIGGLVAGTADLVANRSASLATQITAGYVRLPGRQQAVDVADSLRKIATATADALFNLPALQTAKMWAKRAPAYLYSFDHEGKRKGGPLFLQDSPLTDGAEQNTGVGHGDDLLYVFEPQPLDGSTGHPYEGLDDPIDVRVRDTMTNMIAEFARTGKPAVSTQQGDAWPSFTEGSTAYVSVGADSTVADSFRQCEMALWTGLAQSAACRTAAGVEALADVINAPNKVVEPAGSLLGKPLGGVIGSPANQAPPARPANQGPPARPANQAPPARPARLNVGLPLGR